MRKLGFLLLLLPLFTLAQKKQITLEDIYKKNTFRGEFVGGFTPPANNIFDPKEVKDDSGKLIPSSDYQLSADKKRVIFFTGREPIYRRSFKSTAYLYDVATKKSIRLNEGKILHPTFSPDGSKIAYVYD